METDIIEKKERKDKRVRKDRARNLNLRLPYSGEEQQIQQLKKKRKKKSRRREAREDDDSSAKKTITSAHEVLATLAALRGQLAPDCFCHQALHSAEEFIMEQMLKEYRAKKQQMLSASGASQQQQQQQQQLNHAQPSQPPVQPATANVHQAPAQTQQGNSSRSSAEEGFANATHANTQGTLTAATPKRHSWTDAQARFLQQELKRADADLRKPNFEAVAMKLDLDVKQVRRKARDLKVKQPKGKQPKIKARVPDSVAKSR